MRLACLLLFLTTPAGLLAQTPLALGEPVPGTLGPDSRETYSFHAEAGHFVFGHVNQITVDVVVRLLGPDGTEIGEFDSPARGPENFQVITTEAGTYTVEVSPFERAEGDYEVLLRIVRPEADDPEALVDQLMVPYTGDDVPGVVISIVRDGGVVFARGYGMSNLTYGIPMTPETGMSVASVSKQFTAMAIMLLVGDGLVDLDDDVREHLPELKDFGTPVTLRHMLNHTSGYREILNFIRIAGSSSTDAMRTDEPFHVVNRQPLLQNEPGARYNYNNTTYMLLARLVERVSGKSWGAFMVERIFEPLGMNRTTVKTLQGQVIPGSSQGYLSATGGGYRYVTDFAAAYGASGVNTTAMDITRWMLNYDTAEVGGRSAIDAITTPGITNSGDTLSYGLGLAIGSYRGLRRYSHTGGETAHRTYMAWYPEIRGGIFMSSNNPSFDRQAAWIPIVDAWFADYLEPASPPSGPGQAPVATEEEPVPDLPAFEGVYWSEELETRYTLLIEDGRLMAHHRWLDPFPVNHRAGETFSGAWFFATMEFHRDPVGRVNGFTAGNGRTLNLWFKRVD